MSYPQKAIFNWSGGKDSAFCLYKIQQAKNYAVSCLLTSVNEKHQRVSMHGVRRELLFKQAESIGLPLHELLVPEMPTMVQYNDLMKHTMLRFKEDGVTHAIFGDIFLEDLKKYREEQLNKIALKSVFPLWNINTKTLLKEFIDAGFKAIIVCVNAKHLDKSFAGRLIDNEILNDLPSNVDPCGENGEYHSFVFDGPNFKYPIKFSIGERVYRNYTPETKTNPNTYNCTNESQPNVTYDTGFWYLDLLPE